MTRRSVAAFAVALGLLLVASSASAHSGTWKNNEWEPVFNSNGNLVFKGQTKVVSCSTPSNCNVPLISVTVCAEIYILGGWNQLGNCVSGENANNTQVTRSKIVQCSGQGGTIYNYRTKVTGSIYDHGTFWYSQAPTYSDPTPRVCVA